jgi:hypothetical protein
MKGSALIVVRTAIFAACIGRSVVPGLAATWTNSTGAGPPVLIFQTTTITADCKFVSIPAIRIASGPSHGKIKIIRVPVLPNVAPSDKCYTVKVPGAKALYTPEKGFIGNDKVTIHFDRAEGGVGEAVVRIKVHK